ncbi:hypothetical protein NN561_012094 [Cricetulus griseus]
MGGGFPCCAPRLLLLPRRPVEDRNYHKAPRTPLSQSCQTPEAGATAASRHQRCALRASGPLRDPARQSPDAPGAALGARRGKGWQGKGGSREARFRPPRSAEPQGRTQLHFVELAGREVRAPRLGADTEAKGISLRDFRKTFYLLKVLVSRSKHSGWPANSPQPSCWPQIASGKGGRSSRPSWAFAHHRLDAFRHLLRSAPWSQAPRVCPPGARTQDPKPRASRSRIVPREPKPPVGETPPLALPRRAWLRRQRRESGHLLTAGPLRRPTRVPLVSSSSPRASRLARPRGPVRAGRGCGVAASSTGPGPTWFRVPGPVGKLGRRARPLPGGLPALSCASRARHSSGAGRRGWEASSPSRRVPDPRLPVGELGGDHPEAPISAQGEGDVARRPEALRAPLRELSGGGGGGGGSQGRVLLAAAPGTSRPPRRRSHGDRKPSRHPERPALAPRVVPDESWPPGNPDPSWLQATVRTLE